MVKALTNSDVAIVGMACLFPGAEDLRTYWENIIERQCLIGEPPKDWVGRYALDPESTESDRIYNVRGGFLGELSQFDPIEHGILPNSIDGSEPEHFLALRVAAAALADAGVPDVPLNRERTDVVLGRGTFVNRGLVTLHQHGLFVHQFLSILKQLHPEYTDEQIQELRRRLRDKLPPLDAQTSPGMVSSVMSGRIANRMDLRGKNYCLDAACASSLIAVEHGIRDLMRGSCDAVLAGGVHVSLNPLVMMMFTQLGALTRDDELRPFSKDASGSLLGEGVGMVVLKRLSDAIRDGNRIYCVVKSLGSASDGKAKSVVAPRVEGEALALRRAYDSAEISPETIGLLEAHGTGMPLGDEVELEALTSIFGDDRSPHCALGTVKSNLGHLLHAAGIAGLIKTALALYQRTLPPTGGSDQHLGQLTSESGPIYINTEARPWVHGAKHPRRAGVSAFGFGGINAHAILEEYRDNEDANAPSFHTTWDSELCVFAAQDRPQLIEQLARVRSFLQKADGTALKDVACTLARDAGDQPQRLAIVAESIQDLMQKAEHAQHRLSQGRSRIKDRKGIFYFDRPLAHSGQVAFLFPGEGAQYENMLADLCMHFPEMRRSFDEVDEAFHQTGISPPLSSLLFPPPHLARQADERDENEALWRMDYGVQCVTTANRALFRLLKELKIRPDVMVGHSSGEFAALEASGAVRFDKDADFVAYIQGGMKTVQRVAEAADRLPKMRLVAASADDRDVFERLVVEFKGRILVAMDNCPLQIVACGDPDAAKQFTRRLHKEGVSCTELPFHRAYHTPWFADACGPLEKFYDGLSFDAPKTSLYSCATADVYPSDPDAVRELAMRQWCTPVQFRQTVLAMYEAGVRLFVEVGPRGNLSSFVGDILGKRQHEAVRTNVPHRSGTRQLNEALGLLIAHHVPVDLEYLYARRASRRLQWSSPEGTSNGTPRRNQKLEMRLPSIELGADDLKEIARLGTGDSQDRALAGTTEPTGSERPANDLPKRTTADVAPAIKPQRSGPGDKSFSAPERRIASRRQVNDAHKPPTEVDPIAMLPTPRLSRRGQMMEQHFQTMANFMSVQRAAVECVGARRNGVLPYATSSEMDKQTDTTSNAELAADTHGLPFIGDVLHESPGEDILIRRVLDIHEDVYLLDHVLGGRVSMYDSSLTALPVNPLTMSIEMIAQVASRLLPGKVIRSVQDIQAYRWMTVEDTSLELEMHGRRTGENQAHVVIREADSEGANSPPIIEATVILAESYTPQPEAGSFHVRAAQRSRFTAEAMYKTAMFNGPSFQGIEEIEQWGEDGQVARLRAPNDDNLFRSDRRPRFLTSPVILDAAGQTIAHWNGEHDPSGFRLFPYRVDELRIHAPGDAPPARLESRLRIEPILDSTNSSNNTVGYRANLQLVDPDGRLWIEIIGWHVKLFDLPETFYGMLHDSPDCKLSEAWQSPLNGIGAVNDGNQQWSTDNVKTKSELLELRRVTTFSKQLLLGHGRIWLKALAHQVFTRREREKWQAAEMGDKRRIEYLLGRVAAKDAVRHLVRRLYGVHLCPGDIEIEVDASGRPVVARGPWLGEAKTPPRISISHSGSVAVALAVAAEAEADVGVDVEHERSWDEDLVARLFTADEQALLGHLTTTEKSRWYNRLWCAKEAVAKATGMGIGADPGSYKLTHLDPDSGNVEVKIVGSVARMRPDLQDATFCASTSVEDAMTISTSACNQKL